MSMEDTIDTSSILETEFQSIPTTIKPFWEFVNGTDSPIQNRDSSSSLKQTTRGSSKGSNLYFLVAIFVLVLAVLGGLRLTFFFLIELITIFVLTFQNSTVHKSIDIVSSFFFSFPFPSLVSFP
jgi:hypothetical protein